MREGRNKKKEYTKTFDTNHYLNRDDFVRFHRANPNHAGIIVITNDMDRSRMATRINEAITVSEPLSGKLIRVVRPS